MPSYCGPSEHKETADYVYSKVPLEQAYGYPTYGNLPLTAYKRSFVSVGGISIVYDYSVAAHPAVAVRKQFWHPPGPASGTPAGIASPIAVNGSIASAIVGSSTLWIKALLPASPTITAVQNLVSYYSGTAGTSRHFEISDPNQASNATNRYLTVLAPTASSVGSMPATTLISASGFQCTLYDDGAPRVVLFSVDGTQQSSFTYAVATSATVRHVIADLAPGTYAVSQGATVIATQSAGADGTISFTSAGGGTFTSATITPLSVSPASASVLVGASILITASNGVAPYTWSAPGATVMSGSGATFSTSFATAGSYTITVTDASGATANISVTVAAHLPPARISGKVQLSGRARIQ